VPIGNKDHHGVPVTLPITLCRCHQPPDLVLGQVLSGTQATVRGLARTVRISVAGLISLRFRISVHFWPRLQSTVQRRHNRRQAMAVRSRQDAPDAEQIERQTTAGRRSHEAGDCNLCAVKECLQLTGLRVLSASASMTTFVSGILSLLKLYSQRRARAWWINLRTLHSELGSCDGSRKAGSRNISSAL
jgi:hypothetical protein